MPQLRLWRRQLPIIFYTEAWQAQQSWVGMSAGPDHRYVVAEFTC